MAISGGHDWDEIMNTLHAYVVAGSGLAADKVVYAQQDAPRPEEPAIIMNLDVFDDVGMSWLDHEPNPHTFDDFTVTADDVADTLTAVAHERLTGDGPVRISSSGTLPGGLEADTDYWIIKVDDDTFQLAETFKNAMDGTVLDITSTGSGTITIADTDDTLRAGEEIKFFSRAMVKATLTLECYTNDAVGMDMATALLNRVRSRSGLPSQRDRLDAANIGLSGFDRVFSLDNGVQDAFVFEPRASMNVQLTLPSEESETGTIIESTEITDESEPKTWTVGP